MPENIHPTAVIDAGAQIHPSAKVWHFSHVRSQATLEENVSIGRDVFVDAGVTLGQGTRVQNGVSIYAGVEVSPWCFIGPHVTFTNDLRPRVGSKSWKLEKTKLGIGMSIGAGAVIICGIEIGPFAMIGAGTIVTRDVPSFHLVTGNPGEIRHLVCACGASNLPMDADKAELIADCCKQNLLPPVLVHARRFAERFVAATLS